MGREEVDRVDSERFAAHCEWAASVVATWPAWKRTGPNREVFGNFDKLSNGRFVLGQIQAALVYQSLDCLNVKLGRLVVFF